MKKLKPEEAYSPTPIGHAVLPLKQEAVERSRAEAKALVERVSKNLEEHGWDMRLVAPYPAYNVGANEYRIQMGRYRLYSAVTKTDEAKSRVVTMRGPHFVKMCPKRIATFIEQAAENAAASYDAFVAKLDHKIGPVKEAILKGNHVWGNSILTVVTEAGNTEHWHTQMIVNVSKYHLLFNQFPTRKLKERKAK